MPDISAEDFDRLVEAAIERVPSGFKDRLSNIAFLVKDEPTAAQRKKLGLGRDQLLFGLYEGTPLPQRGGAAKVLPDKITIFKKPLLAVSVDRADLADKIGRTVWHEVAHYFGLDHQRIWELESKNYNTP